MTTELTRLCHVCQTEKPLILFKRNIYFGKTCAACQPAIKKTQRRNRRINRTPEQIQRRRDLDKINSARKWSIILSLRPLPKECPKCLCVKDASCFLRKKNYLKNCTECAKKIHIEKRRVKDKKRNKTKHRVQYNKSYGKKWRVKNKDYTNAYIGTRQFKDPLYRLSRQVRTLINQSFKIKDFTKAKKTFEIIGCTPEYLKSHLESQFKPGMSWIRRHEWHIDHIVPLASAKTRSELIKLNHYSNLQPLWAIDNLRKSNR